MRRQLLSRLAYEGSLLREHTPLDEAGVPCGATVELILPRGAELRAAEAGGEAAAAAEPKSGTVVVRVSGVVSRNSHLAMIENCEGLFKAAGERRGKLCFTHVGGTGALYFDGAYWKLCRAGVGPSECGWNFSQRHPGGGGGEGSSDGARDDPDRWPPAGAWRESERCMESPVNYGFEVEVICGAEADTLLRLVAEE